MIKGAFTDHRAEREYPDFSFAFIYPQTWSAEDIRMSLFAWVNTMEKAYKANAANPLR